MPDSSKIGINVRVPMDRRLSALVDWLGGIEMLAGAELQFATDDASYRRYFRLQSEAGSFIAMDAPPPQEDCRPFVQIAGYLSDIGLNAPRVIEANLDEGFLLLTDLGRKQYFTCMLAEPTHAATLYADALEALRVLQKGGVSYQGQLQPYDDTLLRFELSIFREWLIEKHLGLAFTEQEELAWATVVDRLVQSALDQPRVFVHRDYHSRNLMVTGRSNPGILDFQGALEGPLTYDLVSLLKDCYVRLPDLQVRQWALGFYGTLDEHLAGDIDEQAFMRFFDLMGVQRHLKAAGIFARLLHRDGKPGYMEDVPRTLGYISDLAPRYEELAWLNALIDERCLPSLEGSL